MNLRNFFYIALLIIIAGAAWMMVQSFQQSTQQALQPLQQANQAMQTQIAELLNPTPTIIPDPVSIIHDVRALARLETVQYSVEKVVTAETNQGALEFLFGDRLLLVAHGVVIAGVDLQKLGPDDLWLEGSVLHVRLPEPEIFIATLNNDKSYVYDRETGLLTKGNISLETQARQVAEAEIRRTALEDGILNTARINAEAYLSLLFRSLGYDEVIFER
jgi:hypothetical protein